ncbi:MAG: integrase core domain-containing protein [Acidimicrobiales bacterium]
MVLARKTQTRPNHPTTTGKVERFQQTKRWLTARQPADTISDLQHLVDQFVDVYNNRRAHTAVGKVPPAIAYKRLPKDQPNNHGVGNHYRIRYDRIDQTGAV